MAAIFPSGCTTTLGGEVGAGDDGYDEFATLAGLQLRFTGTTALAVGSAGMCETMPS